MTLLVTGLLLLAPAAGAAGADRPPNIVHVVGDDIGYDDIGAFGAKDIPTPNLDRLARQGMRLTRFYAPSPLCTPTRAAILTGSYAPRVGLPDVLFPFSKTGLADSEITIAELLKARGYATALVGKWHLGHQAAFLPTRHGFDRFFGILRRCALGGLDDRRDRRRAPGPRPGGEHPRRLQLRQRSPARRPRRPAGRVRPLRRHERGAPARAEGRQGLGLGGGRARGGGGAVERAYPPGSTSDEVVAGFDLYTTFARVGGAEPPADRVIDGRDIRPILFGEPGARSPHEALYYYRGERLGAVRSGRWKLVFAAAGGFSAAEQEEGQTAPAEALYDLETDPGERRDVLVVHPDVASRVRALAERARDDIGDAATGRAGRNRRPSARVDP